MADNKFEKRIYDYFAKSPSSKKSKSPITIVLQKRKTRLKSDVFLENLSIVPPDGEYDIAKENFDLSPPKNLETYKTSPKRDISVIQSIPARRSTRLKSEVLDRSSLINPSENNESKRFVDGKNVTKSLSAAKRTTRLKSEVLDRSSLKDLSENDDCTGLKPLNTCMSPTKAMKSLPARRRSVRLQSEAVERRSRNDSSELNESTQLITSNTFKTPTKNDTDILQSKPERKRSSLTSENPNKNSLNLIEHNESAQSKTLETFMSPTKNDTKVLQSKAERKRLSLNSEVLDRNSLKNLSKRDESAQSKTSETLSAPTKEDKPILQTVLARKIMILKSENACRNSPNGQTGCESVKISNIHEKLLDTSHNSNKKSDLEKTPSKMKKASTQEKINNTDKDCNNLTPKNNQTGITIPAPPRRLTRLRSVACERICLSNLYYENNSETLNNESTLITQQLNEESNNKKSGKRANKKKISTQESGEKALDDVLMALDKYNTNEQTEPKAKKKRKLYDKSSELFDETSPETYENYIQQSQTKEQTESSNIHRLNEEIEPNSLNIQASEIYLNMRKCLKKNFNKRLGYDPNFPQSKTSLNREKSKNVEPPRKNDNAEKIAFKERQNSAKIKNNESNLKQFQVTIDGLKNLDITSQTDNETNALQNITENKKSKVNIKKRKMSCQEMAENLIDSIDTNAIVDMLINTNSKKEDELANQDISKRQGMNAESFIQNNANGIKKNVVNKTSKKLTQRKKDNIDNTLNISDISLGIGDNKEEISRKRRRNSTKHVNKDVLNRTTGTQKNKLNASQSKIQNDKNDSFNISERRENFFKEVNSSYEEIATRKKQISTNVNSNKSLNIPLTHSGNQKSIMNYFKVQNKKSHENAKCSKLSNKEKNTEQNTLQSTMNSEDINKSNTSSDKRTPTKTVKKRGRPPLATQRVNKVNLARPKVGKRYTKISKLTKEQAKKVKQRKIPKERLDDVLSMMDDDDHPMWEDRNISCNPYIFQHWKRRQSLVSDQNMKLKLARQFILRRDWINLSKVLGLFNTSAKNYYPLLAKYAALLLGYTDKEQFEKFIQFLTKFNDSSAVIKKCTQMPTEEE